MVILEPWLSARIELEEIETSPLMYKVELSKLKTAEFEIETVPITDKLELGRIKFPARASELIWIIPLTQTPPEIAVEHPSDFAEYKPFRDMDFLNIQFSNEINNTLSQ